MRKEYESNGVLEEVPNQTYENPKCVIQSLVLLGLAR